jgi:hypothetical protein
MTFAPFSAKDNEQALPIPLAAPVTITTLSLNNKYIASLNKILYLKVFVLVFSINFAIEMA